MGRFFEEMGRFFEEMGRSFDDRSARRTVGPLGDKGFPRPILRSADGCGFGMHEAYGRCEGNLPGPGARFDPANPGCWYNDNNDLRCY